MPRISLTEAHALKQDADETFCASCRSPAMEGSRYCWHCHDYWTNDAPAFVPFAEVVPG